MFMRSRRIYADSKKSGIEIVPSPPSPPGGSMTGTTILGGCTSMPFYPKPWALLQVIIALTRHCCVEKGSSFKVETKPPPWGGGRVWQEPPGTRKLLADHWQDRGPAMSFAGASGSFPDLQ